MWDIILRHKKWSTECNRWAFSIWLALSPCLHLSLVVISLLATCGQHSNERWQPAHAVQRYVTGISLGGERWLVHDVNITCVHNNYWTNLPLLLSSPNIAIKYLGDIMLKESLPSAMIMYSMRTCYAYLWRHSAFWREQSTVEFATVSMVLHKCVSRHYIWLQNIFNTQLKMNKRFE